MPSPESPSKFFSHESAPGIALFIAMVLAILIVNTPLRPFYDQALNFHFGITPLELSMADWIKDGLMVVFFLFVTLELKRELVAGVLAKPKHAALPLVASIGGTVVPAVLYLAFNTSGQHFEGWAIPSATDIAFSLGVLSLFGKRVPNMLKAFLLALGVLDDLFAVLIIAFGYTTHIEPAMLSMAVALFAFLLILNKLNIQRLWMYWMLGFALWAVMLHSGVHPTLAGVLLAFSIPFTKERNVKQPLLIAEHALRPWVQFGIMPLFAFAFAGVHFSELTIDFLQHPVPLGIFFGLAFGKPIGIMLAAWLFCKLGKHQLPMTWYKLAGVGCLAGIGFTMSLFIGGLAFPDPHMMEYVRTGVYAGSILSGMMGALLLSRALPRKGHATSTSSAAPFLTRH